MLLAGDYFKPIAAKFGKLAGESAEPGSRHAVFGRMREYGSTAVTADCLDH